ncbi:MAG: C-terminal target protein [Ferruginibacter sp.]|nr:C-terminal target protein [Ferruginibacter sp.]
MKNRTFYFAVFFCLISYQAYAQQEKFSNKQVLNQTPSNASDRYFLQHPFEIIYGADDSLWISERRGRVMKVDPSGGKRRIILDIQNQVKFTTSGSPVTGISQDGMMGLALHPDYPAADSFIVAYTYDAGAGVRKVRIAVFPVKNIMINSRAGAERVVIENIPASSDHSSGRLIAGADNKLYYSVGDQGANQFGLRCNPIRAQDMPTTAQLSAGNYIAYQGKVLRINLDGTVPSDNPVIKGIRSHVFTFGHRNPNSLVFAKDAQQKNYASAALYSAENGPAEDDEINKLVAGKNYGWPHISGYRDNIAYQYKNWSSASNCAAAASPSLEPECSTAPAGTRIMNETDTVLPGFTPPIRTFFTPTAGLACSWLSNPTVAPSSMDFYGFNNRIPGWQNSVLMTTLKEGTVFRLKLSADGNSFVTLPNGKDTARYFREENRMRDIAIGKDGISFFIVTDSVGQTSGPTTGNTNVLNNRGSILVYRYSGSLLDVKEDQLPLAQREIFIRIYPNPATKILFIENRSGATRPIIYIVYDMLGRQVLTGKNTKERFEVNIEKLQRGMHTIKLLNGYGMPLLTQKILLQ